MATAGDLERELKMRETQTREAEAAAREEAMERHKLKNLVKSAEVTARVLLSEVGVLEAEAVQAQVFQAN